MSLLCVIALFSMYLWSPVTCSISCNETVLNSRNYTAFETMLLTERNLVALENAFFPTNLHSSTLVDVYYHFIVDEEPIKPAPDVGKKQTSLADDNQLVYYNLQKNDNSKNSSEYFATFRWSVSPINLYMRPELLKRLSLETHQPKPMRADLYLLPPCEIEESHIVRPNSFINFTCVHVPQFLVLLNHLTTNVSLWLLQPELGHDLETIVLCSRSVHVIKNKGWELPLVFWSHKTWFVPMVGGSGELSSCRIKLLWLFRPKRHQSYKASNLRCLLCSPHQTAQRHTPIQYWLLAGTDVSQVNKTSLALVATPTIN